MTIKNAKELNLDERSLFREVYTEYFDDSTIVESDPVSCIGRKLKNLLFSKKERYALEMLRRIDSGYCEALVSFEDGFVVGFIVGEVNEVEGNISHFYSFGKSFLSKRRIELELLRAFSKIVKSKDGNRLCACSSASLQDLTDTLTSLGFNYSYGSNGVDYYFRSTIM